MNVYHMSETYMFPTINSVHVKVLEKITIVIPTLFENNRRLKEAM